jgi:hypothetical protein
MYNVRFIGYFVAFLKRHKIIKLIKMSALIRILKPGVVINSPQIAVR